MEEKQVENHNEFDRWDCMGAVCLLGVFPAVITFFFGGGNINETLFWGAVAVAAAAVTFALSYVINAKLFSFIVNTVGWLLAIFYIFWAIDVLKVDIEKKSAPPARAKQSQAKQ